MAQARPSPPLVARLIESAAQRLGYKFSILDPDYGYLCEVRHRQRSIVLAGGVSPVNRLAVGKLCKDKHYTSVVVERAGYRVPQTVRALSPRFFTQPDYRPVVGIEPALRFAAEHGFPLIVKPNQGSKGIGVTLVEREAALAVTIDAHWRAENRVVLVQEPVPGRDFRLNFVGGEFIGGYERKQLVVEGDGERTFRDLLEAADSRWADDTFVTRASEEAASPRLDDILLPGEQRAIGCDTVLNLNKLATASIVEDLPEPWLQHCLGIGRAVGAQHFGVDIRSKSLEDDPAASVVIEVNSSPLLTGLYELGFEELAIHGQSKVLQLAFETS